MDKRASRVQGLSPDPLQVTYIVSQPLPRGNVGPSQVTSACCLLTKVESFQSFSASWLVSLWSSVVAIVKIYVFLLMHISIGLLRTSMYMHGTYCVDHVHAWSPQRPEVGSDSWNWGYKGL